MELMTNKKQDLLIKKLYDDTKYRKFVNWKLVMIGLDIGYERYSSEQGLNKAYNFLIRHAPEFKGRFLLKAKENGIVDKWNPENVNDLNIVKNDFYKHHDWIDSQGSNIIRRPNAIRVCQVIGMDIWDMCSPKKDSADDLKKPYVPYERLLLSMIIS